jgi:hypothetical protein
MAELTLEPGETIVRSVRKHPLILIGQLIPFAFLAWLPTLLPNVLAYVVAHGGNATWIQAISFDQPWPRFVLGIFWLFVWMGAFSRFTNYYLDQWIITDHRIVRIEQVHFWDREVSSVHMNRIQDVMTEVNGVLPTLFGYGTLSVEDAAEDGSRFRMRGIQNARGMRDLIMKEVTLRQEQVSKQAGAGLE